MYILIRSLINKNRFTFFLIFFIVLCNCSNRENTKGKKHFFNLYIDKTEILQNESKRFNLKKMLASSTNKASIYGQIGLTYLLEFKFDDAIDNYQKGLKYSKKKARLYKEIGFAYYMKNNFKQAIKYYLKQINRNLFDGTSYYFLAECYFHLKDYSNSKNYLQSYKEFKFIPPTFFNKDQIEKIKENISLINRYVDQLENDLNRHLIQI